MPRRDDENGFRFAPDDAPLPRSPWRWGLWAVLALVVIVLGAGATYLYRNPLAAPQWLQKTAVLPKPAPAVVYKWRDSSGAWHITDTPPAEGLAYERLEYHRDTNILPLPPQLQPKD
jgi:hypothetical protein